MLSLLVCCWFSPVVAAGVRRRRVRLRAEAVLEELRLAGPRLLERVEVVAVADVDERLAPVVHLRQVVEQISRRRERDVGPVADLGRPLLPFRPLDDVGRLERAAHHLLQRLVDALEIVGEVDGDRRRPGRHDAEHVALVDERALDLLEQVADPRRVLEVQVQVVDEQDEDAPGRVVARPGRRQDDALRRGGRRRQRQVGHAAAVHEHERRDLLRHAVLEQFEVLLRQVRHELALGIPGDDVVGHQVDRHPERRLLPQLIRLGRHPLGGLRGRPRGLGQQHRPRQHDGSHHGYPSSNAHHG